MLKDLGERALANGYRAAKSVDIVFDPKRAVGFVNKACEDSNKKSRKAMVSRLRRLERRAFLLDVIVDLMHSAFTVLFRYNPRRTYEDQLRFNAR
jgi:hypothetical protein